MTRVLYFNKSNERALNSLKMTSEKFLIKK